MIKIIFYEKTLNVFYNFKYICIIIKNIYARHWWLTNVILATQKSEIRRITVQSQLGQIVRKTLSFKNPSQKRAGGVAQVGLSSNPGTANKQKKKNISFYVFFFHKLLFFFSYK
jgi:hypothetical protein